MRQMLQREDVQSVHGTAPLIDPGSRSPGHQTPEVLSKQQWEDNGHWWMEALVVVIM